MLSISARKLTTLNQFVFNFIVIVLVSACGGGSNSSSPPDSTTNTSIKYQLTASITGMGVINQIPSGFSCSTNCTQEFDSKTTVTLQVVAVQGNKFDGWSGACTGTANCIINMSQDESVTAMFSQLPTNTYQLTVNSSIGGTVKSESPGIDCGTDCTEIYDTGTTVNLTAMADNTYTFIRWSGACSGNKSCTINITKNQSVTAYFSSGNTANLCDGLVTDKIDHPMTALAKPANGSVAIDPEFGTSIRRITAASSGSVIKPMYSTIQAWNADESYLILYHTKGNNNGHHLYNGKTYKYIRKLPISPADLEQVFWHTTDPDIVMYIDNSNTPTLISYHISTNVKNSTHVFNGCNNVSSGGDPMFTSWDSDVLGLLCSSNTGKSRFSYQISTNTEGTKISTTGSAAPQPSPSGNLFFYAGNKRSDVVDFNGSLIRTLDLASPFDHASLGMLADGTDMFYGVDFGGAANCKSGALVAHNMTNGSCRVIIGQSTGYVYPPSGTHISALSHKNPGWVAVSMVGKVDGLTLLNNEIVLVNSNANGSICRIAHHRSWGGGGPQGYWAEPHVVISPSASRVLFGSDWGGSNTVDSYVVELPAYTP